MKKLTEKQELVRLRDRAFCRLMTSYDAEKVIRAANRYHLAEERLDHFLKAEKKKARKKVRKKI